MNEFEFDRLLELYEKDQLTHEEKTLVDGWFDSVHTGMDSPLTAAAKDGLKGTILHKIKLSGHSGPADPRDRITNPAEHWKWIKIAASLLLLFLVGFWAWRFALNPDVRTYTSDGTITKVSLPDGSLVWLKGESSLESPLAFVGNTRNVTLRGEALFEVAKDAHHPFIIRCNDITTTVLGTSFNLKSSPDQVELTVLTGKVSITSAKDSRGTVVLPNEKAVYDHEKLLLSKHTISLDEWKASVDGTEYEMIFNDVSMNEVIRRIEEKFGARISLSNEAVRKCKIRANFSDQSLENTLDMICQALGLRYSIKDNKVQLTGNGCI